MKVQPTPSTTYNVDISATDALGRMYFLLPRGLVQSMEAGTPIVRLDRTSANSTLSDELSHQC